MHHIFGTFYLHCLSQVFQYYENHNSNCAHMSADTPPHTLNKLQSTNEDHMKQLKVWIVSASFYNEVNNVNKRGRTMLFILIENTHKNRLWHFQDHSCHWSCIEEDKRKSLLCIHLNCHFKTCSKRNVIGWVKPIEEMKYRLERGRDTMRWTSRTKWKHDI